MVGQSRNERCFRHTESRSDVDKVGAVENRGAEIIVAPLALVRAAQNKLAGPA